MATGLIVNILLSIASGILLALAFPKYDLFWLAWVALVPFFLALKRCRRWQENLLAGLAFGLCFFGIHFFWVTTLYRFVKAWIWLGVGALVVFQALFMGVFAVFSRMFISGSEKENGWLSPMRVAANAMVGGDRRPSGWAGTFEGVLLSLGVAALWTAVEWLRAWGPLGFTGGDIGYSQVHLLPLVQIAAQTSVYGVTFIVVLFNIALTVLLSGPRRWLPLVLSLVLVGSLYAYGWQVMRSPLPAQRSSSSFQEVLRGPSDSVKLALIQANIDQEDKLNSKKVFSIYRIHEEMSRQAAKNRPDIIIWPETVTFTYLLRNPALFERTQKLARDSQAWLVMGVPRRSGRKAYNSIISISPQGVVVSSYDKERLVPFGEYLPFRRLLLPVLNGVGYYDNEFSSNPVPRPLSVRGLKLAAAICFESTLPEVIRARATKGPDFILLVTNDAWFGDSAAPYFHLNAGVFRAIENRRYFVQVGNTGISAVIDPFGRILKKTKVNRRQTLFFEMPLS